MTFSQSGAVNRNVIQLALAQALMMSVNTLLITASSIIGYELATDKSLATLPLAIQFCSTMLTAIPASLMMGRVGRKYGFMLSTVLGIIGGSLAWLAQEQHSFWLYCIATAFIGVYTGFGNFFRFVATEVSSPQYHSRAISYVLAGGVLAAIIGPNLANLTRDLLPVAWTGSFIAVLIIYVLNGFNLMTIRYATPVNRAIEQQARPLSVIAKQPAFIVALLAAAIGFAMMSLLMTATPLAMKHEQHPFNEIAFVIQWHVLGMFAPSFFTGNLINRFGADKIIFTGGLLILLCIVINLLGVTVTHFWLALLLLGLGWNFMFIGGTSMLTRTYNEAEKSRVQAANDFIVFSCVTLASLGSGILQHWIGWQWVNLSVVPFILVVLASIHWLNLKKAVNPVSS